MNIQQTRKGFSLIELMVAISIVAILATIGFTSYNQSQVRARDAKRKQDLRALATALELYYQKNKRFPCISNGQGGVVSSGANWITDATSGCANSTQVAFDGNYISAVPVDPLANDFSTAANYDTTSSYGYFYNTPGVAGAAGNSCPALASGATYNNQYFVLKARLENPNDPDRCELKQYKNCAGTVWCPTGSNSAQNRMFIITSQ